MKMHKYSLAAALTLAPLAALAGSLAQPIPTPAVTPVAPAPAAYNWSGPYVGLAYGQTSGSDVINPGPTTFTLNQGTAMSVYGGYLVQRGSLVYGGELALSRGSDTYAIPFATENVSSVIDIKGRVGYAMNKALIYGVLGYSSLTYDIPVLSNSFTTAGVSYGIGVDYAVSNKLAVGLEYLTRQTSGNTFNPGQTADIDLNTVSLRVTYSF